MSLIYLTLKQGSHAQLMIHLFFDDPFPAISIPVYTGQSLFGSAITTEYRVLECYFNKFTDGPVINALSISKFHIDRSAFTGCRSNSYGGAVRLEMSGNSLAVVSRTCASDCQCGESHEGNFVRFILDSDSLIKSKASVAMVSIDQCQKEEMNSFHSLIVRYGIQEISNLNISNCKSLRNSGFTNYQSIYGSVEYSNLVNNEMGETLLIYATGYNSHKFLNIIRNKCNAVSNEYYGLIINKNTDSFLSFESSFFSDNICQWLIQNGGTMSMCGCQVDSFTVSGNPVPTLNEVSLGEIPITLLASCGLYAALPYRFHRVSNNNLMEIGQIICMISNFMVS